MKKQSEIEELNEECNRFVHELKRLQELLSEKDAEIQQLKEQLSAAGSREQSAQHTEDMEALKAFTKKVCLTSESAREYIKFLESNFPPEESAAGSQVSAPALTWLCTNDNCRTVYTGEKCPNCQGKTGWSVYNISTPKEEKDDWISVKDMKPNNFQKILLWDDFNKERQIGYYHATTLEFIFRGASPNVTHWMPLPKAPAKEGEADQNDKRD